MNRVHAGHVCLIMTTHDRPYRAPRPTLRAIGAAWPAGVTGTRSAAVTRWAARLVGAGLLATMGGIHLHLYGVGFSTVPTIGPLFLLNGILGAALALAMLATPARWLAPVSLAGALLEVGTLGGLVLSLTVGLFGWQESLDAPLVHLTIIVESAGFVVMLAYAAYDGIPRLAAMRHSGSGPANAVPPDRTGR